MVSPPPPQPFSARFFRRRCRACAGALVTAAASLMALAGPVAAHGGPRLPEPGLADFVLGWSFDPTIAVPLVVAAVGYLWAIRQVSRVHPENPVPKARVAAWLAGLAAIAIALQSGVERYDTTLFWIHMVQHVLLTMVAAPLLVMGAPITLLMRVVRPNVRRDLVLPILHSRIVRVLGFPVVGWLVFAGLMWGTHFSPLFDRSLEEPFVHQLEHLAYLAAALLFWWPAVALDPSPWRMTHPMRILYLGLQMPQNTFLALSILNAGVPLYHHYATLGRTWGPTVLADQQLAGGIMWIAGDVAFITAIVLVIAGWMRLEDRQSVRQDARDDVARSAIREREAALAERLAREQIRD